MANQKSQKGAEGTIMKRKIYQQLLDWKEKRNGEVALLVEGARRIGKSYIVEEFARNEYESYILIDFNKAPQMVREWFDLYTEDLDTLFLYLSQHYKVDSMSEDHLSSSTKYSCVQARGLPSSSWWQIAGMTI